MHEDRTPKVDVNLGQDVYGRKEEKKKINKINK